jgi:hypothetical protein
MKIEGKVKYNQPFAEPGWFTDGNGHLITDHILESQVNALLELRDASVKIQSPCSMCGVAGYPGGECVECKRELDYHAFKVALHACE